MIPYSHQSRFVQASHPKWGVWHATGTGKTVTGLLAVKDRVSTCLIVCPKGVKSKWLKAIDLIPNIACMVMTKEEFRKESGGMSGVDAVIIDEAHHFSGMKSQMHKSMVKYIKKHKIKYIYPMTATPYRREAWNIYALARILGHEWDYSLFRHMFYYEQRFGSRVVWLPKKGMEKEIAALVRSIGDVVSYSECGDMPPITYKVVEVDRSAAQIRAMHELEMIEANPLTYYMREHQIMSGIFMDDYIDNAKEDYILDLCESNDKVAVICRYTDQIIRLRKIIEDAGYNTFVIDGRSPDKNFVAEAVEGSKKAIVIIQADSAEGFEIPSVNVVVFASMSYSYLAHVQSLGRFIRINKQNGPKLFIYLITKKTIDEDVYKNIMNKKDFDLAIYSNNK